MPGTDDADEAVPEERLRADLGTGRARDDARFQIDDPVAKWRAVFIDLLHEAQHDSGSFRGDARNQVRTEVLDEAVARSERERSRERPEIRLPGGTQHRFAVLH